MTDITKLSKKQLLDILEGYEENKWDDFKEAFGVTYNTDEEWIDFFKSIQESRAELTLSNLKSVLANCKFMGGF